MSLASGTLMLNMRYMSKAISRLPAVSGEGSYSCDGRSIRYDPAYLLERYKQSERLPVHDCLHMLLHCVFRHWHTGADIDRLRWNAACDIAVEAVVMKIGAAFCANESIAEKSAVLLELSLKVKPMTAEKLYAYFVQKEVGEEQLAEYSSIFGVDDHNVWYPEQPKEYEEEELPPTVYPDMGWEEQTDNGEASPDTGNGDDGSGDETGDSTPSENDEGSQPESTCDEGLEQWLENERRKQAQQLEDMWRELAKEIKTDLEDFGRDSGEESRYLVQMLERLERERCDYGGFLRRFAVSGEMMRADLDSFETGYYSYGMQLYGNVALIEPLEYKETKLVRDFVIAIDTSGSVSGKLVQCFMQKTYNILKSTESFFKRVNIYIIQCDTEVRDAVCLTCLSELEDYIAKMELKGLGGTDFRPVFDYVAELRRNGSLGALKGLIYFTDGCGEFPETKPPYDTVFAFVGETETVVPPWAVKLVLEEEDIINE